MKKLIKKFLSATLIIALMLSCFTIAINNTTFTKANAQSDLPNISNLSTDDEPESQKTLYYFSDNTHCTTYSQNLLDSEIVDIYVFSHCVKTRAF